MTGPRGWLSSLKCVGHLRDGTRGYVTSPSIPGPGPSVATLAGGSRGGGGRPVQQRLRRPDSTRLRPRRVKASRWASRAAPGRRRSGCSTAAGTGWRLGLGCWPITTRPFPISCRALREPTMSAYRETSAVPITWSSLGRVVLDTPPVATIGGPGLSAKYYYEFADQPGSVARAAADATAVTSTFISTVFNGTTYRGGDSSSVQSSLVSTRAV